jgi:hypothetical protein
MNRDLFSPPAIVREAEDLVTLASRIKAGHEASEQEARSSLVHARQVGDDLIKAKSLCGHGHWLKWLQENTGLSQATAKRYMRIARHWDKSLTVSDLTQTEVLERLSTKEEATPDNPVSQEDIEAMHEVHDEAEAEMRKALEAARSAGEKLHQARAMLTYDAEWEEWLADKIVATRQEVDLYMHVADDWSTLSRLPAMEALQRLRDEGRLAS